MTVRDIRKIYTDKALIAEYNELADAVRSLDDSAPIPPPVHIAALDEMRRILASLERDHRK